MESAIYSNREELLLLTRSSKPIPTDGSKVRLESTNASEDAGDGATERDCGPGINNEHAVHLKRSHLIHHLETERAKCR